MNKVTIIPYSDTAHRGQVVALWEVVFGYAAPHNKPGIVIDKKIAARDQLFFVALAGDAVVGTVMAGYDGHRGWIYSLAVLPEYRGRGLGSRLMRHAEEDLNLLGCLKINLQIIEGNEAVAAFYRKLGYQTEQRISMGKKVSENITLAEPGASPNGGPAMCPGNSGASGGPPVDAMHPEVGEFYDELPLWSAPFGLLLLERVPMRPGLTVLDVGAGTGFLTLELVQRCGPHTTVIAVDPWAAGMRRLRRKLAYLGLENVQLLEQDAATLALPDASIDLVVSNLGINNFANADAVLRTCFRVLKPAGKLLLTTNLVGHMREFYEIYRDVLHELGLVDRLTALEAHVQHRATVESVSHRLNDAGFKALDVVTATLRMRFADGSSLLRHYFIRLGFLSAWQAVVSPDDVERTFAALERKLNAVAAERGELSLTIPIACVEAQKPGAVSERYDEERNISPNQGTEPTASSVRASGSRSGLAFCHQSEQQHER